MNNLKVIFVILSQLFFLVSLKCVNSDDFLFHVSSKNKNLNTQIFKTFLVSSSLCHNKSLSKCFSRIEVKGWLNVNEKGEAFVLIDEVFDLKEQMHLVLLHPYLIQLSMSKTLSSFPLNFEQNVKMSCSENENDVQTRKKASSDEKNFPFTANQLQSYDDLINDILIEEKNAIKNNIQKYDEDNTTNLSLNLVRTNNVLKVQLQHDTLPNQENELNNFKSNQNFNENNKNHHEEKVNSFNGSDKNRFSHFVNQYKVRSADIIDHQNLREHTNEKDSDVKFGNQQWNNIQNIPSIRYTSNVKTSNFDPINKEDDPNMLIANDEINRDERNLFTRKFNRRNVETQNNFKVCDFEKKSSSENFPRKNRYSIYSLSEPTYQYQMKIQIFLFFNQTWNKIQPTFTIYDESEIFTNDSFHIKSSIKNSFSQALDHNNVKLAILNDEESFSSCFIYESFNETFESFADKFQKSICLPDVNRKYSPRSIHEEILISNNKNPITKCPFSNDKRCLNVQESDTTTWRLNITIPLRHNEIFDKRSQSVKISNIFVDTSDGINLFVQFEITSMNNFIGEFNLSITNCDIFKYLNASQSLILLPNKSTFINLSFQIPFDVDREEQKCKANIVDKNLRTKENKIIAQREFLISRREKRCLCLWMCSCFCFDYFLTAEVKEFCHNMPLKKEIYAGFVDDRNYDEVEDEIENWMIGKNILILLPLVIVFFILIMGFIKAILGCFFKQIDIWKFNYVQACKPYRDSGRCWKFLVNSLFFFLLPVVWCCGIVSNDDENEKSFYANTVMKKELYSDDEDDHEENWKLLEPNAPSPAYSSIFESYRRSSETIFNVTNLRNPFDEKHQQTTDDETFINDTEFVVNAMNESHESLRKLSHYSEENIKNDERFETADKLVKEFLAARIVYRRFNQLIGGVKLNNEHCYSIRGYFIPATNTGYQFITYNPIRQFYEVSSNFTLIHIAPQIPLDSKSFRCYYANKIEVLEANDLSLQPSTSAPCINVKIQDRSMYGS